MKILAIENVKSVITNIFCDYFFYNKAHMQHYENIILPWTNKVFGVYKVKLLVVDNFYMKLMIVMQHDMLLLGKQQKQR